MEEVSLTDTEMRYYGDLFTCCDVEKTGKVPMLKATELYRSANISDEAVNEIISIASVPSAALYISRVQFYSCLKLIAAHQAGMQLRQELLAATVQLPLPHFSWKETPSNAESIAALAAAQLLLASNSANTPYAQTNGAFNGIAPPPVADRKNSLTRRQDWPDVCSSSTNSRRNSSQQQQQQDAANNSDLPSTDSEVEQQNESSCGGAGGGADDIDANVSSSGIVGNVGGDGDGASSSGREGGRHRRRRGSPEAWSTNSDSPTPTNSVAERPWAKENLWQGLLGDEHRQLLGTEEESSDRHSSEDDDDAETDLEAVYQITPEQRDYYYKQFKAVQHDTNGLLSGPVARVFFEKSRIPVEELRHIWQLCDVTRDGALSLAEFTAAMHLVVLRRNNIPLPAVLPACLHPSIIYNTASGGVSGGGVVVGVGGAPPPTTAAPVLSLQQQQQHSKALSQHEPPEADLLHLNDDDEDNTDNTIIGSTVIGAANNSRTNNNNNINNNSNNNNNDKNVMNISTISNSSQASTHSRQGISSNTNKASSSSPNKTRSISNSPKIPIDINSTISPAAINNTTAVLHSSAVAVSNIKPKDCTLWTTDVPPAQWTKFTESPTSNVSSPGLKPANFDMQRTAQAVVSDPQILHPVPLRVTPVAASMSNSNSNANAESNNQENIEALVTLRGGGSPKHPILASNSSNGSNNSMNSNVSQQRESLQQQQQQQQQPINSDLRAIQRPQPKKLAGKNVGALPPPPQREPSIGSNSSTTQLGAAGASVEGSVAGSEDAMTASSNSFNAINKRDIPPLPPPRPQHRHLRSSSLDLNKFKLSENSSNNQQAAEITTQASFDLQTSTGFADFTQFSTDGNATDNHYVVNPTAKHQHSFLSNSNQLTGAAGSDSTATAGGAGLPPTRLTLHNNQRVSAFEVYRKPNNMRNNSQSPTNVAIASAVASMPMPLPFGAIGAAAISSGGTPLNNADLYEKRVNAITEQLRHVSFKSDSNMSEVLRHLKEQNNLLLCLCNDLSEELITVQNRKEELRQKLESFGPLLSYEYGNSCLLNTNLNSAVAAAAAAAAATATSTSTTTATRTGSSISAPVTANVTGGSGSSGIHSNV